MINNSTCSNFNQDKIQTTMSCSNSDCDDVPELPADTLAILEEFRREQAQKISDIRTAVDTLGNREAEIDIAEDWQLSQFWYDERTAELLAKEALRCVGESGKIALISCPTLYRPIVKDKSSSISVNLFEFDSRFAMYGKDFVPYDYNQPLNLPEGFEKSFDVVIADPPFLSKECLEKVAITIKFLCKEKIILCSGVVMQSLAKEILGLEKSNFVPCHKNNLGNQFGCFTNYDINKFLF